MAFRVPARARELGAYFRSEQRTLRQGFAALLGATIAAFVAGVSLSSIAETLEEFPGLLILIPATLGLRGGIFGAMGARLGTSIHAGLFEVTRSKTGVLHQNVFAGAVLTLSSTLYLAVLAKLAALAFGLPSIPFLDFVTISVIGGIIDSALIMALTIGLAVVSYKRGYDLDTVATPLITATADMIVVPILYLATFIARIQPLSTIVGIAAVAVCIYGALRGFLTKLPLARRAVLEMSGTILLTPLLDILAGTVVEARLERFVAFPGLLVLVPPFVAVAGSTGGILASRLSSKLQLGVISPRGLPEAPAILDASLASAFGIVAFALIAALGLTFSVVADRRHPGAVTMIGGTLSAGLLVTALALVVAYYVAILTTRFRLDPDNHSVPVIMSTMDLVGIISFLSVLTLFGVELGG